MPLWADVRQQLLRVKLTKPERDMVFWEKGGLIIGNVNPLTGKGTNSKTSRHQEKHGK